MSETEENTEAPLRRVKPEIITAAVSRRDTIAAQLQAARGKQVQCLADATAAERDVDAAITKAAEAGTEPDPAVMLPLQQAQANAELQRRMVLRLEEMLAAASADIRRAQHEAHVGMYAHGIEMRIAAAAKIELGRLTLQAGYKAHKAATETIQQAARRGVQHPQFNGAGGLTITMPEPFAETTTEAGEREFWEALGATDGQWPHTPESNLLRTDIAGHLPVAI